MAFCNSLNQTSKTITALPTQANAWNQLKRIEETSKILKENSSL